MRGWNDVRGAPGTLVFEPNGICVAGKQKLEDKMGSSAQSEARLHLKRRMTAAAQQGQISHYTNPSS